MSSEIELKNIKLLWQRCSALIIFGLLPAIETYKNKRTAWIKVWEHHFLIKKSEKFENLWEREEYKDIIGTTVSQFSRFMVCLEAKTDHFLRNKMHV